MHSVSAFVDQQAAGRLAATMGTQAAKVNDAIRRGRPLDAEDSLKRKLVFIQRRLGVGEYTAARIAAYEDPKHLGLTAAQEAGAESLQGGTVDFVEISFLDVGRAASRSVARVAYTDGSPVATGFMVAPTLFLTNHHVIGAPDEALRMVLEFNYELDADGRALPVTRFRLDPQTLFISDGTDDLDYTLVAVGESTDGPTRLADFGYLPLLDTDDKHMKAIFVNVIQHPDGRPKELVTRENRILARTANTLIYGADTLQGSSGSPVFNDDWEVVALHHWGSPSRALRDSVPDGSPKNGNEGIRISSIVGRLRKELTDLDATRRALVEAAIQPGFRKPSLSAGPPATKGEVMKSSPRDRDVTKLEAVPRAAEDGSVSWTIPLVMSIRLDGYRTTQLGASHGASQNGGPGSLEIDTAASAEALKPDTNYSTRRGYNAKFLGIDVPLPALSDQQRQDAAENQRATAGDRYELKYEHFSVVMNGKRRLPFFTAVNIDGAHVVKIDRNTGQVTSAESLDDGAEAYEKWWMDGRIDASESSDQSLYDDPELKSFQRGHLVKRTDPSWGAPKIAVRGQADTFHFTNCSPQHERFNPNAKRWAGLENWITNGSDDQDMRVTVFTGPIFQDNDPKRGYIKVPLRFWKVVVRVDNGKLLATAAVADQTDLVKGGERLGPEDLPKMPTLVKVEQVKITRLEELTGLKFGDLRNHDTFHSGGESIDRADGGERLGTYASGDQRPIMRFADYQVR